MISLKKREHISAKTIETNASIGPEASGTRGPGALLCAILILSFCCRYSQAALLSSVHYNAPEVGWLAPDASLLLLPAAAIAYPLGQFCGARARNVLVFSLCMLAVGLAASALLLGQQVFPTLVVALSIILIAVAMESARICIWTQMLSDATTISVNNWSVQLFLGEVAATALGINCFRVVADMVPLTTALRSASLLLTATFLLCGYLFARYNHKKKNNSENAAMILENDNRCRTELNVKEEISQTDLNALSASATVSPVVRSNKSAINRRMNSLLRVYPVSPIALTTATNTTVVTLLVLTLSSKVVANIHMSTMWSAAAFGMIFGCLYCLLPTTKLHISRWFVALALSTTASALCIFKPAGQSLFIGLFLSGFAATITNVTGAIHIFKLRHIASPGILLGCQAAFTYLFSFTLALVIEPRIESLSSFVFVRLLAMSQLVFLTVLGSVSYIILKYRRSQV